MARITSHAARPSEYFPSNQELERNAVDWYRTQSSFPDPHGYAIYDDSALGEAPTLVAGPFPTIDLAYDALDLLDPELDQLELRVDVIAEKGSH